MQPKLTLYGLLLAFFILVGGCTGAGETAVVTERPTAPQTTPSTPEAEAPRADPAGADTVQVGRFDTGKMWTFDNPPLNYFQEAYGFRPDDTWFERARLGALRFSTYCSASFVSPNGLVLTNHHCARESVTAVSRSGEDLLDAGFYAEAQDEERKVPDLYVDQLVEITDVTDEMYVALRNIVDDDRRAEVIEERTEQIEKRMTDASKAQDSTLHVEVISLYHGGRYSAYTFRRYDDVRLVMAPELQLGFFGGDPDNFTYPRYSLDMSFFRVYDAAGAPLQTTNYFPWSVEGTGEGDVVFVIGNPGSTSRLGTVSQLLFERTHSLPQELVVMRSRADLLKAYLDAHPEEAAQYDLENDYFSIRNSIKSMTGQLEGLYDEELIARRAAADRELRQAVQASDSLQRAYGTVFEEIEEVQRAKEATVSQVAGFTYFGSPVLESHVLLRALYGYIYDLLGPRGVPQETLETYRSEGLKVKNWPPEVEKAFLAARLRDLQQHLGTTDPTVRRLLQGGTPEEVAERIVDNTALVDSAGYAGLLEKGYLNSGDPTVPFIEAVAPLYFQLSQQFSNLEAREDNLNAQLARARFDVHGTRIPPDASFSLRLADGVVKGYSYNGTLAPSHTTFFGLYNHYHAHGPDTPWDLPERWLSAPAGFERSTPLNLVSTNDITGGNSGSPLLNQDLEIVGLIFDSNIEALPNVYLYREEAARAISVDARGILESLDAVYDADRVVLELTTGRLVSSEAEADALSPSQ